MRILADTNVLLRLSDPAHALHRVAIDSTDRLRAARHELMIVPQNLYEFWSVSTRTVQANGLGRSTSETDWHVARLMRLFTLLRDERSVFEYWNQLVSSYQVTGVKAHDTRLVAAMMRHELTHMLTFNVGDFGRYREITVMTSEFVLESSVAGE